MRFLAFMTCCLLTCAAYGQIVSRTAIGTLNSQIPEVIIDDQSFEHSLQWIAEYSNWNMVVRWKVLEAAGVSKDATVSLKLKNLRVSQVLSLVLEQGSPDVKLAYRASDSLLVISTDEDLSKEIITRVYDVSDLLLRIPSAGLPQMDVTQGLGQSGQGSGMFQSNSQSSTATEEKSVKIEDLINLITATVMPDSWAVNGGKGQIRSLRSLLIVSAPVKVHQALGGYVTE